MKAQDFLQQLKLLQSEEERIKIQRYFKADYSEGDEFMGVKMGSVFALAKEYIKMSTDQIELLLESPIHEARAGGVSIMDFKARNKKTSIAERKEIFDLYILRHDRINNWDLVDRSAPYVVGGYLFDKPRDLLYKLAVSNNLWERRTSIVSTCYFIKNKQLDDTYRIAKLLLNDPHELIHKAAGGWVRAAGAVDRERLKEFLNEFAAMMPRTMLRYSIEHLDKSERDYYLKLKKTK